MILLFCFIYNWSKGRRIVRKGKEYSQLEDWLFIVNCSFSFVYFVDANIFCTLFVFSSNEEERGNLFSNCFFYLLKTWRNIVKKRGRASVHWSHSLSFCSKLFFSSDFHVLNIKSKLWLVTLMVKYKYTILRLCLLLIHLSLTLGGSIK